MRLTTGQKETRSVTYLVAAQLLIFQSSLGQYVTPIYFGALARQLGYSNQQLAAIGTTEAAASIFVVIAIALFIGRLNMRKLCLVAAGMLTAATLACALTTDPAVLLILRALVGASATVISSAGMVYVAATAIPVRWFGVQMTLTTLLTMAGLAGMPIIERQFGLPGFYVTLVLLAPATFWAAFVLPAHPKPASEALKGDSSLAASAGWRNPAAIIALLAILAYAAYIYPMYNFSDRIGTAIGLAPVYIGFVLSATTPIGVVGSLLATTLGNRFGAVRPIAASAVLAGIGYLYFHFSTDVLGFWVAISVMSFIWNFAQPYLVSTVGRADPDGRFVFLNGLAFEGGRILTTFVFAASLSAIGPAGPALLGTVLMTLSALLIYVAVRFIRTGKAQEVESPRPAH